MASKRQWIKSLTGQWRRRPPEDIVNLRLEMFARRPSQPPELCCCFRAWQAAQPTQACKWPQLNRILLGNIHRM